MVRRRGFRRQRRAVDPWLMLSVQRATIASIAGRLDLVDSQAADALTDQGARLLDLEDRVRALELRLAGYAEPRLPVAIPELPWVEPIVGS